MDERSRFYERMLGSGKWDDHTNPYETQRRLDLIFGDLLADFDLKGKKVLDGGSGGGHFSEALCERGADVVSLDVGPNLLAQVAARCDSECVEGSILEIPFDTGTFDLVLSTEVIEHTPDPMRAVTELCRVVKPGGTLVLTSPNRLWQPVVRAATTFRLRHYQGHENFLWSHRARDLVHAAGLDIEEWRGFNFFPIFRRPFEPLLALADLAGSFAPSAYINFALRAHKPHG